MIQVEKTMHLASFRGVGCERERTSINKGPIALKAPTNNRNSKTEWDKLFSTQTGPHVPALEPALPCTVIRTQNLTAIQQAAAG